MDVLVLLLMESLHVSMNVINQILEFPVSMFDD